MRTPIYLLAINVIIFVLLAEASFSIPSENNNVLKVRSQKPTFSILSNDMIQKPAKGSLSASHYRAGGSIPMTGGLLTLGAYFVDVAVGRPATSIPVIVDTGSSNLVVPAKKCTTCGKGPSTYSPESSNSSLPFLCKSTSCQKCNPNGTGACVFGESYCFPNTDSCGFGISYGGGSSLLSGYYVYDNVCIGTYCANATVGVGMAEYPSDSFSGSGILGLASTFNGCNPTCIETVFDSFVKHKQVPKNLFGMCLTPSKGGLIDMGEVVTTRYTGTLEYVPMEVERWYNIILLDIQVGSTSLGLPPFAYATTNDVIGTFVDSGTSVVLFSPLIFQLIQGIFQSQFCKLPGVCGNSSLFDGNCIARKTIDPFIAQFPKLTFVVSQSATKKINLTVPPSSYLMDTNGQYCLGLASVPGVGVVLGDVFMENYYVVFDRENKRLGFAPLATCQ